MNTLTKSVQTLPTVLGSQAQEEQQQYLTFILSGETYAISIVRIKEIIQYGQVTEVPRMPDFIRGVINLRGAVVAVIDLSARFSKQPTAVGRRNCIIIIEVDLGADIPHPILSKNNLNSMQPVIHIGDRPRTQNPLTAVTI